MNAAKLTLRKLKIILLVLCIPYCGFCQVTYDACKERVKNIYTTFNDQNKNLSIGQQIYYHYTTEIQLTDSLHNPQNKSEVRVTIGKNKIVMLSEQAEFYQDEYDAFSVLPEMKLIYCADSKLNDKKNLMQGTILELQDSLFNKSIVKECRVIGALEKIVLALETKQSKTAYNEIEFWINHVKSTLAKIVVHYPQTSKVYRITYEFQEIDFHHHQSDFELSARQRIFVGNELARKYSGYKVIDSRIAKKSAK